MKRSGLVYVFTGDGKGKTSAALGVAMRAVGHGKRVTMIQWYKERRWPIGEHALPTILKKPLFEIYPLGQGFHIRKREAGSGKREAVITAPLKGGGVVVDTASEEDHRRAAQEALHLAKALTNGQTVKWSNGQMSFNRSTVQPFNRLFLLILDEVINAVNDGLIDLVDLIDLISKRGETHIILTGRGAPKTLIDMADLVTEMKNVKHPYDLGKKAIQGLDF